MGLNSTLALSNMLSSSTENKDTYNSHTHDVSTGKADLSIEDVTDKLDIMKVEQKDVGGKLERGGYYYNPVYKP